MEKRNSVIKKIVKVVMILVIAFTMLTVTASKVFADVGSFERYSGGSSSSSSHSSSHSSYSGSSSGSSSSGSSIGGIIVFAIIVIVFLVLKNAGLIKGQNSGISPNTMAPTETPEQIEAKVKANDPMFNKEKMESWAGDVFVKLQNAWTNRDWSIIRPFESNELFEQHNAQLQEYINTNRINVMDRICVESSKLVGFRQAGDKDVLDIDIRSCMKDYIIDATTKQVLEGDKTTDRRNTYRLTFIRKTGVLTKEGEAKHSTTNCPNCGAPTQVTMAGKCDYCGSIITTGEHDWVLSGLRRL